MKCPYCIKVCSKCKKILVANEMNFSKDKKKKYGLRAYCKQCQKKYREDNKERIKEYKKKYYENNKDKIAEYGKKYYEDNKEHCKERNKQYREDNKDKIKERNKQYREDNKDKIKERNKKYYENNKDKIAEKQKEYNKKYYQDNKDKEKERAKQYREEHKEEIKQYNENNKDKKKKYREDNKDKIKEKNKQYYKNNPHILFNNSSKRRLREEQQGNGITKEQWLEMMKFFDFRCAYSGEYIGGNSEHRTIDHIIPLNKGGLNEIWNICPMYSNYNFSKNANDMLDWYQQQEFYSEERLNKIYEWQQYAYNKWGNDEAM